MQLQENRAEIERRGATLVALSVDPIESSSALATKEGLTFPILSDPDLAVIRAYGVEDPANKIAWPALFIIGPGPTIERRFMLENYKERPTPAELFAALGDPAP